MSNARIQVDSLVLYKSRPARVLSISDKIEIQLQGGKTKRVRLKDLALLHPGPVQGLAGLGTRPGEILEAWELLGDASTDIAELSELIFGEYIPATAWATWELVKDGLYFSGTPDAIEARPAADVERERQVRASREAAEQAWSGFLERMERGALVAEDRKRLSEVEMLALGKRDKSRILQELGHQQVPEQAHRLLVKVGYWCPHHNPYPGRAGVSTELPHSPLPALAEEARRDLGPLAGFAIDDEGNQDPDDAISLDGERVWVHIADVAALIAPDSEADREARARGANLYLPERTITMLPPAATRLLGLGLDEVSLALSVGFSVSDDGLVEDVEISFTRVRVTRLTYGEVDRRMDEAPFRQLAAMTGRFRDRRRRGGAASIDLPEVSIRVVDGEVVVRPLRRSASRTMVTDAMLMAGEAVARYAIENRIPIPFATQVAPENPQPPMEPAAMYGFRKLLKPSRLSTRPEPHAGLGLELYTRVTSPLRRYCDLVVHQQLRAWLRGGEPMTVQEIGERIGVAEIASANIRRAERMSNRHWTLVYLMQNPDWQGRGVIVERSEQRATLILPELAMETRIRLRDQAPLNAEKKLRVREVQLADLSAYFQVLG